jgi:hypothetical protein
MFDKFMNLFRSWRLSRLFCAALLHFPPCATAEEVESYEAVELVSRSFTESHAPSYAKELKLVPLSEGVREPEVRVWHTISVFGTVNGWVIRPGRIDLFTNERIRRDVLYYGGVRHADDFIRFDATRRRLAANALMRSFAEIARMSDAYHACGVKAGAGLEVEGVVDGHYFSYGVNNPWICKRTSAASRGDGRVLPQAGESRRVARALMMGYCSGS